jgi:hypothetical protein
VGEEAFARIHLHEQLLLWEPKKPETSAPGYSFRLNLFIDP